MQLDWSSLVLNLKLTELTYHDEDAARLEQFGAELEAD
jgi:hypothetical protein